MSKELEILIFYWLSMLKRWKLLLISIALTSNVILTGIYFYPMEYRAKATLLISSDLKDMTSLNASFGLPANQKSFIARLVSFSDSYSLFEEYLSELHKINPQIAASADKSSQTNHADWDPQFVEFQEDIKAIVNSEEETIHVSMTGRSAREAIQRTQAVANAFINLNIKLSEKKHRELASTLEEQNKIILGKLTNVTQELSNLYKGKDSQAILNGQNLVQKYVSIFSSLSTLKAKSVEQQAAIKVNKERIGSLRSTAANWITPQENSQNRSPAGEEETLSRTLYNSSTLFEEIRKREAELEKAQVEFAGYQEQEKHYQNEIQQIESDMQRTFGKDIQFEWLKTQLTSISEYQSEVNVQALANLVAKKSQQGKVVMLETPIASSDTRLHFGPFQMALFALGAIFLLACLILGSVYKLRNVVLSQDQLRKLPDQNYLGSIPFIDEKSLNKSFDTDLHQYIGKIAFKLKVRHQKTSTSIMVSSSHAGVGKTFTTLALAGSLRKMGNTVALIDLDIKKGGGTLIRVHQKTHYTNELHQIKAPSESGDHPFVILQPNGKEMDTEELRTYIHNSLKEDIKILMSKFDVVIVDCAPISIFDTLSVSELVDRSILCIQEGQTRSKQLTTIIAEINYDTGFKTNVSTILTKCELKANLEMTSSSEYYYAGKGNKVA